MDKDKAKRAEQWRTARAMVEGGGTYAAAAEYLGVAESTVTSRASREAWVTPQRYRLGKVVRAEPPPDTVTTICADTETLAAAGRNHRARVMEIVQRALATARPDRLTSWADIERAARISDKAAGLDKPTPAVSLVFPSLPQTIQSSDKSPFLEG